MVATDLGFELRSASMTERAKTEKTEIQSSSIWKSRETSPERTKIWTEPKQKPAVRRIPVVYYLCRNGLLEHPHFMEVPLSSPRGLYLRDVVSRLNLLRGQGFASMYSWSCKRSYKNGYVWQDLGENDFIYPAHGQEYILKGSELLSAPPASKMEDCEIPDNQSWSSNEFNEYKVYKAESSSDFASKATDASTQTDRHVLNSTEISPPSDSSPETLESLMKDAEFRNPASKNFSSGRMKASAVLMQLISCGSMSFCDIGGPAINDDSIGSSFRSSPGELDPISKDTDDSCSTVNLEQKEFFSGSLVEWKKDDFSSSNADRSSQLAEKETEVVRTKCMPRKPKASVARKDE